MSRRRTPESAKTEHLKERVRADKVAAILGVEVRTVQALAKRGELPGAAKVGAVWTFDEAVIRAYIKEHETCRPEPKASEQSFLSKRDREAQKAADEALQRLRKLGR